MSRPPEKLAVMFADICGSTALYGHLGDDSARQLIAKCLSAMLDRVIAYRGTLIKTIGDEIMCTFLNCEDAMNAACAMQIEIEDGNRFRDQPMHIRIGFHYGDVICEANDVYGDTVNIAARVASITRASQIMTTLAVVALLPPDLRAKTNQIMRAELKGKQEHFDIFRVTWEADDVECTRIGMPKYRKPPDGASELILRCRNQSCTVSEQNRSAVLGRDELCAIVVKNDFASRQHARIELRFGKFVIVDQSTNGTYVRFDDGHSVRLSHEDLVLHRSGAISLGQPHQENPNDVVEFSTAAGAG